MADLKDSGKTREFGTGAHRDAAEGKGRCDLLPLDSVAKILKSKTILRIHEFMEEGSEEKLYAAVVSFMKETDTDQATVLLELAKHYEDGANKYGANNWKKGIPLHVFIDSSIRHYLKWHRKDTDEPHDRAVLWNLLGAIWTYNNLPEMVDIESCKSALKENIKVTKSESLTEFEFITEDGMAEFLDSEDEIE